MTTNPAMVTQDGDVEVNINDYPPPAYGANEPATIINTAASTADLTPPPSYEDAAKDAPPSYSSVFGQMQGAHKESTTPLEYGRKIIKLLLNTFCVTIFMLVVLAIPICMIVLGCVFFNDCPIQEKIPLFLIIMGSVYIIKNMADLRTRWQSGEGREQQQQQEVRAPKEYENFFSRLLGCFLIVFFITGNVWIYSIYPIVQTEDEDDPNYCNPVLYFFSFWLMTVVYIICCLTCCCICCTAGAAASSNTNQQQ